MKKLISIILFLGLFTLSHAQKVIENPAFTGTTAPYVNITKITMSDTATILDFEVYSKPNSWIFIPNDTYIRNSEGGEKLFVKNAIGIKLKAQIPTGETGVNKYSLYFPPVKKDVEKIDYEESQWKIFDIELVPQEHFSIFPEPLLGNWLRTDGSNEWAYGFYKDGVIYDSDLWKQVLINQKNGVYQVLLQKDGKKQKLLIKQHNDNLLIGADEDEMELFSREKISNPDYTTKDDEELQLPVFKNDSAWYKGYLRGYNPKMGSTGMVYVNNVLSGEQESCLITVNADGTFSAGFPMLYPQPVFVRFLGMSESVYFEPGKTTFQCFDLTAGKGDNYLFMGETAQVNNDLLAMKFIRFFNYQEMKDTILDILPEEYKTYIEDVEIREMEALKEFRQNNPVCKKARQIKEKQILFGAWENTLSYNMNRQSVHMQNSKAAGDQQLSPLERVELTKEFFDFINSDELNNPLSVVTGGEYYFLINRVKYADPFRPQKLISSADYDEIFQQLESENVAFDPEVKDLMKKLSECESNEDRMKILDSDSALYYGFMKKNRAVYTEIVNTIVNKKMEELRRDRFKEYLGTEAGFAMDVMNAQDVAHKMESSLEPLNENQKENLKAKVENQFIVNYLLDESKKLEAENARKLEAYKNKSGFVVNETPEAKDADLFDTIMKKYKGKLVFVDFWATWCGPCRSGMKRIKPLKEEMKNKDIAFVYITNPSSPEKTWELMVPEIDGEHYRVTQDEWNQMSARFKVSGIPHYVLVGKDGTVLRDKVYFASSNTQLKSLFAEYLE